MLHQVAQPDAAEFLVAAARWCVYGWLCGYLAGWARWGWAR